MLFPHPSPALPSQVGHPARLADGSLPCLAAQLLIYQITESPQSTGSQAVPATQHHACNVRHHGGAQTHLHQLPPVALGGVGGVSPALPYTHHWPCIPTPLLVVALGWEEFSFWCRESLA